MDVTSTTKGFLPPRMTAAQLAAIPNPADGLVIFNTTTSTLSFCVGGEFRSMAPLTDTSFKTAAPTITLSGSVFNATATGVSGTTPVDYQWYAADDASGTNAFPIAGATAVTYATDGVVSCGRWITVSTTPVQNGVVGAETKGAWQTPVTLTVNHDTGTGAAVSKTIYYGLARFNGLCWLTQNLGAATGVTTQTPTDCGWYFQFGRHAGHLSFAPYWATILIQEPIDWGTYTDPCMNELGVAWRLPTSDEFTGVNTTFQNGSYGGVLKLGCCGAIDDQNIPEGVGIAGNYWTSTTSSIPNAFGEWGNELWFVYNGTKPMITSLRKRISSSVRCVRN